METVPDLGMNSVADLDETLVRIARAVGYDVDSVADFDVIGVLADQVDGLLPDPQELRVAAAACNGAAGIRRTLGSFLDDDGPDRVSGEAETLESVAAKLAALAETLDVHR